jgi:mannosyltransferase
LFRRVPLENLNARDPNGNAITPTIARFKIAGTSNVQIENPVAYDFGDAISLVGFSAPKTARAGESWRVKLNWRERTPIDNDYTVFVHLVDANGRTVAQKDNQPQGGAYPTSFLDVGETIADEYVLEIPRDARGEYRIVVGLYNAADGMRLMLKNGADHVELGSVSVSF